MAKTEKGHGNGIIVIEPFYQFKIYILQTKHFLPNQYYEKEKASHIEAVNVQTWIELCIY